MRARVKITPCEKRRHAAGREKNQHSKVLLFPRRVSPFLAWGDFHARSPFAHSTIVEEKWGTTRSLYANKFTHSSLKREMVRTITVRQYKQTEVT